jgi:hypothetical protein
MKTSRPLLSGNIYLIRKYSKSAAWLITGIFISCIARAQVAVYSFHYKENVKSDYSSLRSVGNTSVKQDHYLLHVGQLEVGYLNDSLLQIRLTTDSFLTTQAGISMPHTLAFYAYTNPQYRIYKIYAPDSNLIFFSILQSWLGEIHFRLPASQHHITETKADGDFGTSYILQEKDAQLIQLKKTVPVYIAKPNSTQAIVTDNYQWESNFNRQSKFPEAIRFIESKKQIIGRRILACIQRQLTFNYNNNPKDAVQPAGVAINTLRGLSLYPRLTEKERKEKLAISLLGQENFLSLKSKAERAETLSNEERFRLKSMFRSLLILDSNSIGAIRKFLQTLTNGSAAFGIIEDAIIESRTNEGNTYINDELLKSEMDYQRLKELLIKISTAGAFSQPAALQLLSLLKKEIDTNTRSNISLALASYAQTIRSDQPTLYDTIVKMILRPYIPVITDTLQYLYLCGNAGIETQTGTVIRISASNSPYKEESMLALRNISNRMADSVVTKYLLNYNGPEDIFGPLLEKRVVGPDFSVALIKRIIDADRQKDSTLLPALKYSLDNTWQRPIKIDLILAHQFQTPAYFKEVKDFRRQTALCNDQ